MSNFNLTPKEIVAELDRHIIGQNDAKKSVAIALRNRWRRQQLDEKLMEEVLPRNILMIGPTGVGKTEIARRLAKLAGAPFLKVEATRFTEVGYVGRDVEQMVRDLLEISINQTKSAMKEMVDKQSTEQAEQKIVDALVGKNASEETKASYLSLFKDGKLDDREVEIKVVEKSSSGGFMEIPGMPGAQMGMLNISEMLGDALGSKPKKNKKTNVKTAYQLLKEESFDELLDEEEIVQKSIFNMENNGIIFLDEVDKIAKGGEGRSADVSREGVQRDLLPLIEGTTVNTKYGVVKTDHILFIASGAFHVARPSDLLPELQGRLPIRVELNALSAEDFKRILTEPEANLVKQYTQMLATEEVNIIFEEDAIDVIANMAEKLNRDVENIGARRLQTVLEKITEYINYVADEYRGQEYVISAQMVNDELGEISNNIDLSRYIL